MAVESLAWPAEPTLTDGNDDANYTLGALVYVLADQPCDGVRWRVPDTVANPTVTGTHAISVWRVSTEARLAYKEFVPTPGVYQDILFDTPVNMVVGESYVVAVHTRHYTFRAPSPSSGWQVTTPSGNCLHESSKLTSSGDPNTYPGGTFSAWYYISPLMNTGGGPEPVPDGVALAVLLGAPAVGPAAEPVPGGVAVPVALGTPAVAPASEAAPAGVAIAITLGTPAAFHIVTPPGVAVPVVLGEPAVGVAAGPVPDGQALPISLGTPRVVELVGPDGVAVPISLGTPATAPITAAPTGVAVPLVLGTPILEVTAVQPGSVVVPVSLGTPAAGPTTPVLHLPILSGTATVRPGPAGAATATALTGTATLI